MSHLPLHIQTGQKGEEAAVEYLQKKDYIILERNWRYRRCEVDIIAHQQKVLHFFEVKTRSSNFVLPEESVGTKKLNKLKEAAEAYLYRFPQWKIIQFNIISITIQPNGQVAFFLLEDVF